MSIVTNAELRMSRYVMPPIYIRMLMALHYSPYPLEEFGSRQQIYAPVTRDAIDFFNAAGILAEGVGYEELVYRYERAEALGRPALSDKGRALVDRICNTSLENL